MNIVCAHCGHRQGTHVRRFDYGQQRAVERCNVPGCRCTTWQPKVT